MIKRVYNWIIDNNLLNTGDTVVCAVSGGADSVAMLHILLQLKDKLGITVEAAHFNHHIRPENETNGDEEFTKELCRNLGVTCHVGSGDIYGRVEETGESVEEAARYLRYEFLQNCVPGAKVATAHHADDNLETMLMKLIRGCGTTGICGIPPRRDNIIRPILCMSRLEVEEYVSEYGLNYVTDSTNHSDDYFRNRVRHHIIPLMKMENPKVNINSVEISSMLRDDNEILDECADKTLEKARVELGRYNVDTIKCLKKAIGSRVIIKMLIENGITYSSGDIERMISAIDSTKGMVEIHLSGGKRAVISSGTLRFIGDEQKTFKEVNFETNDITYWGNYSFLIRTTDNVEYISKNPFRMLINLNKVESSLTIRSTKYGDKIKLPGGTKSISRLLKEKKVMPEDRCKIPVICDGDNIVAVAGIAVDMEYRVSVGDRALIINVLEGQNG